MRLQVFFAMIFILMATAGCGSSRPELFPNDHARRVGADAAERDTDECIAQAERSRAEINREATDLEPPKNGLFAKSELSEAQKVFVDKCLREKGYEPRAWD
jgi:hypothetical protein